MKRVNIEVVHNGYVVTGYAENHLETYKGVCYTREKLKDVIDITLEQMGALPHE